MIVQGGVAHEWEKRDEVTVLRLEGELIGPKAHELRSILLQSLRRGRSIGIDLSAVRRIDRGCLELFCELNRASIRANKLVLVDRNPSAACRKAMRSAGCLRPGACVLDNENQCIWSASLSRRPARGACEKARGEGFVDTSGKVRRGPHATSLPSRKVGPR